MDIPTNDNAEKAEGKKQLSRKRKPNPISTLLGRTLKQRRIAAQKSQETLAFEAVMDRTFISSIERGVANPSVLALANICHCLNITMADLFEPMKISLAPDEDDKRRANRAESKPRVAKSRLR